MIERLEAERDALSQYHRWLERLREGEPPPHPAFVQPLPDRHPALLELEELGG